MISQKIFKRAIMTICSNNYLPYARVLLSSVQQYHPEASLFLCLADIEDSQVKLGIEGVEVIEARTLNIPNFADFAFRYDIMEFNTAVKPFMMRYLLERRGFERVVYLDPDIELFAPMTSVFEALDTGADFVLTPHITAPAEDSSLYPDDIEIMKAGIYNLGFIAVSDRPSVIPFLHWWGRRLRFQCINRQEEGIFVDQKFIDLLPGFQDNVKILRDPTLNVAYWNLWQRQLEKTSDGWLVNRQPLVFFHFSGIHYKNPERLSKHTNRFANNLPPALQDLVNHYISRLKKFEIDSKFVCEYVYSKFENGVLITPYIRDYYKNLEIAWQGNPFQEFNRYLNKSFWRVPATLSYPLTNLMYFLWKQRPDLQRAFDLDTVEGRKNYALWFIQSSEDLGIDPYFLEPVLDQLGQLRGRYPTNLNKISSRGQWEADVSVIGYLRSMIGVGNAGRMVVRSLATTEVQTNAFNVTINVEACQGDSSVDPFLSPEINGKVHIYNINADQLALVRNATSSLSKPAKYTINMPFWELSKFPHDWLQHYQGIDEIWAPTRFIQRALQAVTEIPVVWMPPAVQLENFVKRPRKDFNLPENTFLFHFNFDLSSFASRKNPMAVIDAYRRAFRERYREVPTGLAIKTRGQDRDGSNLKKLIESTKEEPDIFIFNELMTYEETLSLMDCCDCYVSLHRSEGFGYTLAEAMLLGKPVISTDYSGTKDFVNPSTGFPVKYELKSLNQDDYIYWEGQKWADPDIDHAAWLMRRIITDELTTKQVAETGRQKIRKDYSLEVLGQCYLQRLRQLKLY